MRRVLVFTLLVLAACGSAKDPWAAGTRKDDPFTPLFINSQVAVGDQRFVFSLIRTDGEVAAARDLDVKVAFFHLETSRTNAQSRADAVYAEAVPEDPGRGLYIANAMFAKEGTWGVEVAATRPGEKRVVVRGTFTVLPDTTTPSAGEPAPRSATKTILDAGGDLSRITTDPRPDPALYRQTIAAAIDARKPFVVVFSTPKFCTSQVCGPTLDTVKRARSKFPGVDVIHVEVVDPNDPVTPDGQVKSLPVIAEWGLPSEPWVFVIDGAGNVSAGFEGFVLEAELVDAVRKAGGA